MAKETGNFVEKELSYIASLDSRRRNSYGREIEVGVHVLSSLGKMAEDRKETELSNYFKTLLQSIQIKFT